MQFSLPVCRFQLTSKTFIFDANKQNPFLLCPRFMRLAPTSKP
jgi:hypothetical protein